ncbi:uncharacterized protein Bfra_007434 [Botrytis fragariae]|uniref:Uncharacterized protein n=1 Tax=Botrytis fragariae TaxID=1964551 RepID=A0A8H6AIG9_9HELO|nr:uncharacterized protein Bfra_007434 [Botrytis fragariae]KAF5868237.1 hypothetical protein Bfra_007434 [Botrytis fragariae]
MPSGKHRLYIALDARGGNPTMPEKENTYHRALIVGPKKEVEDSRGTRFHAKELLSASTGKPEFEYEEVSIPLRATQLLLLQNDGKTLGTAVIEWATVRDAAMSYCQRKKDEHRFDGVVEWETDKAATFNLIDGKQVIL